MAPLYELNQATLKAPTSGGAVDLSFTITSSGQTMLKTVGNVSVVADDIGALHNTIVRVSFPSQVPMSSLVTKTPGEVPELQRVAVGLLNRVLNHYRLHVAATIRRVSPVHARGFSYVLTDEDGEERRGFFLGGNALQPYGEDAGLQPGNPAIVEKIQNGLHEGAFPLYLSLYLDALADLSTEQYRSGLAHLYMSFEMLTALTFRRLGTPFLGEAAVEEFLLASGDKPGPTVYAVVKQCWKLANRTALSKTKLMNAVSALWKYRNDILHGRPVVIQRAMAEEALEAFRIAATWFEKATPRPVLE